MSSKTFAALALLGASSVVDAFWRMECRGQTGLARIDPIVDTGVVGTHSHTIQGSSGFSMSATYDDLVDGNCTSCAVTQDKSAYWTPGLYFLDSATNEYTAVPQVGGMLAYYLQRGDNVKAFPAGFEMIAGDTNRRNYSVGDPYSPDPPQSSWASLKQTGQTDLAQRALGFNCLDYSKTPEASLYRHYLPNKTWTDENCPDGLRFELMFPSCWNGELTSSNARTHVAYPDLVGNGNCPDTHTKRLVTLFYETIWDTANAAFEGKDGSFLPAVYYWLRLLISLLGYGYHGDFMTGWDEDFLQEAIDTCTNESGELTDCGQFTSNGPIQTEAEMQECKFDMPLLLQSEDDGGSDMKSLPGDVQVQNGPEPASQAGSGGVIGQISSAIGGILHPSDSTTASSASSATPSTSTSEPTTTSTPTSAPSSSSSALGGAFIQSSPEGLGIEAVTSTTSSSASTPAPTTTSAPQYTSELGVEYIPVSTQTLTQGGVVQEIIWEEPVVHVTEDTTTTVTATGVAPQKRRVHGEHIARHRHQHGRRRGS
ncbi:hypothetical protein F5Y18DRAFT_421401 [Xylariaceae sp. FL1019]|nr:hypothetical protein F5Y18DRAFT_421401 [Xylariaceae sp. FL1019]